MAKYTDARYPEKINDLVDNDGNINLPEGPINNWEELLNLLETIAWDVSDGGSLKGTIDKTFKFDYKNNKEEGTCVDLIYNAFVSLDTEGFDAVIENAIILSDLSIFIKIESNHILFGKSSLDYSKETDAETGDSRLTLWYNLASSFSFDPGSQIFSIEEPDYVSGTIRIIY